MMGFSPYLCDYVCVGFISSYKCLDHHQMWWTNYNKDINNDDDIVIGVMSLGDQTASIFQEKFKGPDE